MHRLIPFPLIYAALLKRRKNSDLALAWHYGIFVRDIFGRDWVVHLTYNMGICAVSFHEFSAGRQVEVEWEVTDASALQAIQERVADVEANSGAWRYNLAERNCEHLARWIMFGQPKSDQVLRSVFFATAGLLIYGLAKAG